MLLRVDGLHADPHPRRDLLRLEPLAEVQPEELLVLVGELRDELGDELPRGEIGLVQGQVIDTILSRETLRASEERDFDKLLIPFRAVAGDLATGEAVVRAAKRVESPRAMDDAVLARVHTPRYLQF